jgi:hypothetical protein
MDAPRPAIFGGAMHRRVVSTLCCVAGVLCTAAIACAAAHAQENTQGTTPPLRIGVMHRHGLAGIVTSINGSQIVMQIAENVDFTVEMGSSTRITDLGQDASPGAIRVGDAIFASGDLNEAQRTIQAQVIALQTNRDAQMIGQLRATFGTAWTAGVITSVQADSITLTRMDSQSQTFTLDPGTIYRLRDQPGDFAMVHAGERIVARFRPGQTIARMVTIQGMAPTN